MLPNFSPNGLLGVNEPIIAINNIPPTKPFFEFVSNPSLLTAAL